MTARKLTIVLAGNRMEFDSYVDLAVAQNSADRGNFVYGHDGEPLRSIEAADIVYTGTFWRREDAGRMDEIARTRVRPSITTNGGNHEPDQTRRA